MGMAWAGVAGSSGRDGRVHVHRAAMASTLVGRSGAPMCRSLDLIGHLASGCRSGSTCPMLVRRRSSSPSPSGLRQGRSASASCRSTTCPGARAARCRLAIQASRSACRSAIDRIDLLAERHPVELVQHRLVEALDDAVGLRALGLRARVIDVLHRQVELVLVPLGVAAVLGPPVGQHPAELHALLVEERHAPGRSSRSAAVIGVLRS